MAILVALIFSLRPGQVLLNDVGEQCALPPGLGKAFTGQDTPQCRGDCSTARAWIPAFRQFELPFYFNVLRGSFLRYITQCNVNFAARWTTV